MATLESIAVTLAAGTGVALVATALFGWAVRAQSPLVAPRATARPRAVIYNPRPDREGESQCQDRGSPYWGWIPWTLGLSYEVMLRGVPGTGTRDEGMSGLMLKVNLDGIVLLKFHALCRRVALVATVLFNVFLLPVYLTARCYHSYDLDDEDGACASSNGYNLTNYERLTILNIPSANLKGLSQAQRSGSIARLYATSFVFLALVCYIVYLLDRTYVLLLALRRVYYLEHDIWQERRQELKQTLLYDEAARERAHDAVQHRFTFGSTGAAATGKEEGATGSVVSRRRKKHQKDVQQLDEMGDNKSSRNDHRPASIGPALQNPFMTQREPWIPHPEQRETTPNVSLYSVLVGGLPSIPETLLREGVGGGSGSGPAEDGCDAVDARRTNMDWQLEMATQIFDLCVPNQPGFSSSVAAVTILPGAKDMTLAWRRWYAAASKMRRLAFIRGEIESRRGYEIEVDDDSEEDDDYYDNDNRHDVDTNRQASPANWHRADGEGSEEDYFSASQLHPHERPAGKQNGEDDGDGDDDDATEEKRPTPRPIYRGLSRRKSYFRQVFGSTVQEELEKEVAEAISLGPEQAAVYSRELAQSAAPCCPFGCREDRVRSARIDDLVNMEREAAEELHAANEALNDIRRKVTVSVEETKHSHHHKTTLSFDDGQVPADLDLEAQLYNRMNSNHKPSSSHNSVSFARGLGEDPSPSLPVPSPSPLSQSRRRMLRSQNASSNLWRNVEAIVHEATNEASRVRSKSLEVETSERSSVETGEWHIPTVKSLRHVTSGLLRRGREWTMQRSTVAADSFRDSTYAVVTFTSRQAAVAARMCIADGRGQERWQTLREIPVPPLADAAACDIMACRNCFRPVTISINNRQKSARKYIAIALLALIYVFYTIPLTVAASLPTAGGLTTIAPRLANWLNSMGINITGLISSVLYSLFFSLCPTMFKAIANFGSGASSVAQAEHTALQYYWYFMVITAFSSTMIANMVLEGFNQGLSFGSEFKKVVAQISSSLVQLSVTWFNWIIFRFTVTLPLNYLLQLNSFLFTFLGWKCCARMMRGGGPGAPVPYRLYVDSGVVLMCILALAPATPLLSLAGLAYFNIVEPLLRRNLIFVYRPKFDNGGARWDVIFEMIIVAICVGIVLLTSQMVLKAAIGPAVVTAFAFVPTLVYQWHAKSKYKRSYDDAALLQTALLDGWDTTQPSSMEQREEFRRWLIDAHKAAYVPVCLFGLDTVGCLTAEPAVVIPMESDLTPEDEGATPHETPTARSAPSPKSPVTSHQVGATFRRSVHAVALLRKTTGTMASDNVSQLTDDRLYSSAPTRQAKQD